MTGDLWPCYNETAQRKLNTLCYLLLRIIIHLLFIHLFNYLFIYLSIFHYHIEAWQNGLQCTDSIFKCIFLKVIFCILIWITLRFVTGCIIDKLLSVKVMTTPWTGYKSSPEPIMAQFVALNAGMYIYIYIYICIHNPQCVASLCNNLCCPRILITNHFYFKYFLIKFNYIFLFTNSGFL